MGKTLKAMERVSEIRQRRERVFYKKRMAGKRERELALARKLVSENEHLLPRMRGSEKKRLRDLGMTEEEIEELEPERVTSIAFGGEKKRVAIALEADEDDDDDEEGESGMFEDEDDEDDDDDDAEMDDIDMDAD
jgi:large subunit ribosomal protein L24e